MSAFVPTRAVETHARLDASPDQVWSVLLDVEGYPEWNPGLRFAGPLGPGARVPMRVQLGPLPLWVKVRVDAFEPGRELSWRGGPPGLLTGHHYFRLDPVVGKPGETALTHGERFEGLLLPLLWPAMQRRLRPLYRAINDGLRATLERRRG